MAVAQGRMRSFFSEQARRQRLTWLFVGLGGVWMAILGCLAVGTHLMLLDAVEPMSGAWRRWCLAGAGIAVSAWAVVALLLLRSASRVIPRLLGAGRPEASDLQRLNNVTEEMAIAAGEPATVQWYVLSSPACNALACGRSVRDGSIVVTRGLLECLSRDELQAVIAHELAHLKNGDAWFIVQALAFIWMVIAVSTTAVAVVVVAAAVLGLLVALLGKLAEASESEGVGCVAVLALLAVVAGALIYFAVYALLVGTVLALVAIGVKAASSAISQSREYLADSCAAQWTRNPAALASALAKVAGSMKLPGLKGALVAPLWLEHAPAAKGDGATDRMFSFLLHTHPPIERRIELLKEMAGSTIVTEAPWLAAVRSTRWERTKEWALPLIATGLAVLITVFLAYQFVSSAAPRGKPAVRVDRASILREGTINQPVVRARAGPGLDAAVIARLRHGTAVTILGEQGDWYAVQYQTSNGLARGWVARRLVTVLSQ